MTRWRGLPALLVVAALAAGLAACGGDDDGASSGSTAAEDAKAERADADAETRKRNEQVREEYRERQRAEAPTEDERQAKQTATSFYEILGEDEGGGEKTTIDAAAFCELMSEDARRQTVRYAETASGLAKDWNCQKAIELLVNRSKQSGGFEQVQDAEVLGVNAEGDRATATVRFGDGPATSLSLVKEDGEWKLGASAAGGSAGE